MEGIRSILAENNERTPSSTCQPETKWARRYVVCLNIVSVLIGFGAYVEDEFEEEEYMRRYETYDYATEVAIWREFDGVCNKYFRCKYL